MNQLSSAFSKTHVESTTKVKTKKKKNNTNTQQPKSTVDTSQNCKWKLTKYGDDIICQIGIRCDNVTAISVNLIHYFTKHINLNHMHISVCIYFMSRIWKYAK